MSLLFIKSSLIKEINNWINYWNDNLIFLFLSVLASSLVFNLADGQFSSRADLIDAPGSSLGRGAQVAGLGELNVCHILLFCVEITNYGQAIRQQWKWHLFL